MRTFIPRIGILPPIQQRLWPELRPAAELGFALYGGTAIAIRLGHRASIDFDFFSDKPLDRNNIRGAFSFVPHAAVLQDFRETLSFLVPCDDTEAEQVKLSFYGSIGIGRVGKPDLTEDGVLQVASLDDLMATKVKVILQRIEAKDYRDLAAMLDAGVSLPKALAAARAMYGAEFQPSESLKAMVYFDGGDLFTLTKKERNSIVIAAAKVRNLPHVEILDRRLTIL